MNTQEIINWLRADADFIDADTYDECWEVKETPRGKMLRAAASRLSEMDAALRAQEWQPIETAPGGEVELYFPRVVTGAHRQSVLSEMYRIGRVSDTPNRRPTHWRPLPAAPKVEPQ